MATEDEHFSQANSLQRKAVDLVRTYVESKFEKTDPVPGFDVYVVWFAKTLQNWKALISTTLPDQMYYELTYNGDEKVTYFDAYKKFENKSFPDAPTRPKTGIDFKSLIPAGNDRFA
jgi:hypothetical protein